MMPVGRRTMSMDEMREVYDVYARSTRLWPHLRHDHMRDAYLMGVVDALRTAFNSPRSPFDPPLDPGLRSAYIDGFSIR